MNIIIDFIKAIIFASFSLITIFLIILFLYWISGAYQSDKNLEEKIKECFYQEPKTKECEYTLWKYELNKNKQTNKSANFTNGLVIGTVMAGTMRR